jgi:hypothetical protein
VQIDDGRCPLIQREALLFQEVEELPQRLPAIGQKQVLLHLHKGWMG